MKTSLITIFTILLSFMLFGCSHREDIMYDILKELNQINRRLDKIEHRLGSKEYESTKRAPKRDKKRSGRVDLVKLNAIKFPTDRSKESLRNYVFQVLSASKHQDRWSQEDPQVELLTKIGEENIDILIDFSKHKATWTRYYPNQAIDKLATEHSRKIITDAILENRYLIKTILKNGWEGDVKEILIADIENRVENLPKEWLEAASSFKDRSTYKALIDYFIHCNYKYRTYGIIKDLPGIELEEPIIMAWNKVKYNQGWDAYMMATLAVSYGQREALETLIESLKSPRYGSYKDFYLVAVINHTETTGTTKEEVIEWYENNKSKLFFDKKIGKFKVAN